MNINKNYLDEEYKHLAIYTQSSIIEMAEEYAKTNETNNNYYDLYDEYYYKILDLFINTDLTLQDISELDLNEIDYNLCEKIIKVENKISDIQEFITISKQTETHDDIIPQKVRDLISEKEKEIKTLKKEKRDLSQNTIFENMTYSELHQFREEHKPKTTEEQLFDFKKESQ